MPLMLRSRVTKGAAFLWAVAMVAIMATPTVVMPLPSISGATPLASLFAPSVAAAGIITIAAGPTWDLEKTSKRPIHRYLLAVLVCSAAITITLILLATVVNGVALSLPAVRSFISYFGIGLIGVAFIPEVSPAVPIIVATTLAVAASPAGSPLLAWAVSLEPDWQLWIAPSLCGTTGVLAFLFTSTRQTG